MHHRSKNGPLSGGIAPLIIYWTAILFSTMNLSAGHCRLIPEEKKFVLVIDPGHGGKDPGALGAKTREKDIVLAVALKTGEYIRQNMDDVEVVFTRETDIFVDLDKRAEIANKIHADLFISIHANGFHNRTVSGVETFILGPTRDEQNLELVMKENAVILLEEDYSTRYEGFDPESPESYIIFTLMQNVYQKQSLEFAGLLQDQFRDRVNRYDRGVKQGGLLVLWMTTMPSVLVELGFISNQQEEGFMSSDEGQSYLASAVYRAFRDYKNSIDKKSLVSVVQNRTKEESEEIWFTVQIAATRTKVELVPTNFKGLKDLFEFPGEDRNRYTTGKYNSYQKAVEYRRAVSEEFTDAFVIAVQGNRIIPLQQAREIINR
jgi:N-acetylmuramoyl-L-alanine amidase